MQKFRVITKMILNRTNLGVCARLKTNFKFFSQYLHSFNCIKDVKLKLKRNDKQYHLIKNSTNQMRLLNADMTDASEIGRTI